MLTPTSLRLLACSLASTGSCHAGFFNNVRADFQNITGRPPVEGRDVDPGIIPIQGHIKTAAAAPTDGGNALTESSFGQPFAPYIYPNVEGTALSHAAKVAAEVHAALYPRPEESRAAVLTSKAAFRYKVLLFSPMPGETDVTSHFKEVKGWFLPEDRDLVNLQIDKLREALAISPLDTGLRDLLLDCYYDLAVMEMQCAKEKLSSLAAIHLGLKLTSPFVIDEEIEIYNSLVTLEGSVLTKYAELMSTAAGGVDPSDFDEREKPGKPMGRYIFEKQQPKRNATASQYAKENGGLEVIPDYNEISGKPMTRSPENLVLFAGYKDYTTLLNVMGQYTQHHAELARLRGMRQAPNDLVLARNALGKIQSGTATDFLLLRRLFQGISYSYTRTTATTGRAVITLTGTHPFKGGEQATLTFASGTLSAPLSYTASYTVVTPTINANAFVVEIRGASLPPDGTGLGTMDPSVFSPGDASGVDVAVNGMETALSETSGVRAFLNGTANLLGLDPNFLLLVPGPALPGGSYSSDSYDVLSAMLKSDNGPLSDALAKLRSATTKYGEFRGSVDKVVQELEAVNDTYQQRYAAITGYPVGSVLFDGLNGGTGSELDLVQQSIRSLKTRNETLKSLSDAISGAAASAHQAVTIATGLDTKIDTAVSIYINQTKDAYTDMTIVNGVAAGAQAAFDTASGIMGTDPSRIVAGAITLGIAGAANATAQTAAAIINTQRQKDIDYAAVAFSAAQQKADNALTVNQAKQNLGGVLREQHSNLLETTDNSLALSQALAQQYALLTELTRISQDHDGSSSTVRKSYYADPIHFVLSENSLILADAAFRNAQRWVFYTQRALEYKWQQKFARTEASAQGIRVFDSGTVFKMRNALELDDLLTQLKGWNDDRLIQDIANERTSFISMRNDVLTPNPNVLNATQSLRADNGNRVDLQTRETVSQEELFRRLLIRGMDASGNINIHFDTTRLDTLQADFFVGPNYTSTNVAPGEWRDKIVYLKVNIIGTDGTTIPGNIGGALTYGGQTYLRTRIPPRPDRTVALPAGTPDGLKPTDIAGEFVVAPFRYFVSPNYDNVFVSQDTQTQSLTAAYTGATAKSSTGEEILGSTYQITGFNQRSVAATRWTLTLTPPVTGWDVSKLKDIELIVRHRSSARLAPPN